MGVCGCLDPVTSRWKSQGPWTKSGILIAVLVAVALVVYFLILIPNLATDDDEDTDFVDICNVDGMADLLVDSLTDPNNNLAYERLTQLTDLFGHRISGSISLAQAIDWLDTKLKEDGFDNVTKQPVTVPTWIRGVGEVSMSKPFAKNLDFLALGGSGATPLGGVTGEPVVVATLEEMEAMGKAGEINGKIIILNGMWQGDYSGSVAFRVNGPAIAAAFNASAALIRSVTPFSLYTPHTGSTTWSYDGKAVTPIPAIAITTEDAAMFSRIAQRGDEIELFVQIDSRFDVDSPSHNVIAEITGTEMPEEIIVLGGHIDSWDVGTGATDDAVGVLAAWEGLRHIKMMDLPIKRTIRLVAWTNEENGLKGADAYAATYIPLGKHILAVESDSGVNGLKGFNFTGNATVDDKMRQVHTLLRGIGADEFFEGTGGGADVEPLGEAGAFLGNPYSTDHLERYFYIHHTDADTIDKIVESDLRKASAVMAVYCYCAANAEGW
eukprot:TRINITY_DN813_c0_g1_i2.p1 TRINITY_DN813_c0_g1~~TRINITY_DN813_c0_g1_i2.p1  ORF type:complete len:512 (-),score=83.69 TRINITY_DN813_c0_g1_i2:882-2366(-)